MSGIKCPNIKIYKCSDGFVTDNAQVAKSHEANIKSNKLICPFQCGNGEWYEHCEPVKPDDDIIYKGGNNE